MEELIDEIRLRIKTYRLLTGIILRLDWNKYEIPELCPEPTDDVGLQWRKDDKIFVLSMSANEEITWAYLDKSKDQNYFKNCGTIKYNKVFPEELYPYLEEFIKDNN